MDAHPAATAGPAAADDSTANANVNSNDLDGTRPPPQAAVSGSSLQPVVSPPEAPHPPALGAVNGGGELHYEAPPAPSAAFLPPDDQAVVHQDEPAYNQGSWYPHPEQHGWAPPASRSPYENNGYYQTAPNPHMSYPTYMLNGQISGELSPYAHPAGSPQMWSPSPNSTPSSYQSSGSYQSPGPATPSPGGSSQFHHHQMPQSHYGQSTPMSSPPIFGQGLHQLGSPMLNSPYNPYAPGGSPMGAISMGPPGMMAMPPYMNSGVPAHWQMYNNNAAGAAMGEPTAKKRRTRRKQGPNTPRPEPVVAKREPPTSAGDFGLLSKEIMHKIVEKMSMRSCAEFRTVSHSMKKSVDTHDWNNLLNWVKASDPDVLRKLSVTGITEYFGLNSLQVFIQWRCHTCEELGENLFLPKMCRVCSWCLSSKDEYEVLVRTTAQNKYRLSDKLIKIVPTVTVKPPIKNVDNRLMQTIHIVSMAAARNLSIKIHGSEEKMLERVKESDDRKMKAYDIRLKEWQEQNPEEEPALPPKKGRPRKVSTNLPGAASEGTGSIVTRRSSRSFSVMQGTPQPAIKTPLDEENDADEDEGSVKKVRRGRTTKPRVPKTSDTVTKDKYDAQYRQHVAHQIHFLDAVTGRAEKAVPCPNCYGKATSTGAIGQEYKTLTRAFTESTYLRHVDECPNKST